jgi:hypothetical protein
MLEAHHCKHRSRGGKGCQENLTTLCYIHHQLIIHMGYAKVAGTAPDALRFVIGIRKDGKPPLLVTEGDFILLKNGRPPNEKRPPIFHP